MDGRSIERARTPGTTVAVRGSVVDVEFTAILPAVNSRLERFLTQPFHTTEQFTGLAGRTVSLDDTLEGCERIMVDEFSDWPERALYMSNGRPDGALAHTSGTSTAGRFGQGVDSSMGSCGSLGASLGGARAVHPPVFVPETLSGMELLEQFRTKTAFMVLVGISNRFSGVEPANSSSSVVLRNHSPEIRVDLNFAWIARSSGRSCRYPIGRPLSVDD